MTSANEIGKMMRQTQRYWYEDGFVDMGLGAFMLALGLLAAASEVIPPGSLLNLVLGIGGFLVCIGGGLLMKEVIYVLKERITYPRTGYVSYERVPGTPHAFRRLLIVLYAFGLSVAIVFLKDWLNMMVLFDLIYMASFVFCGWRFGLRRYFVLALWSILLGLVFAPFARTTIQAGAVLNIGVGPALLLAGWLTYRQYLARAPQPEEAGDGTSS